MFGCPSSDIIGEKVNGSQAGRRRRMRMKILTDRSQTEGGLMKGPHGGSGI